MEFALISGLELTLKLTATCIDVQTLFQLETS